MRRADGLYDITRRDLFKFAGCAGALALASSCVDGGTGAIQTGPLEGNNPKGPDAGMGSGTPDGGGGTPDGGSAATCGTGAIDTGQKPASFTQDHPVYHSTGTFFVNRDSGGLYACTAKCTHEGAICTILTGEYQCPRHGALFKYDGSIISGPVVSPLKHFSVCILANGNVGVDTTKVVSASVRLNA